MGSTNAEEARYPPPTDARTDLAGVAFAVLSAVAFGTLAIVAKLAYQVGAHPLPLLTVRFAVAALLLAGFRAVRSRLFEVPRRAVVRLLMLGALAYGVEAALFFAALDHAPASVVSLIFYSFPLWTTIIGFATGLEAFRWQLVAALGLGSAGVVLIFAVGLSAGLAGPLLALGAALAVAVYMTLAQFAAAGVDPLSSAMWTATGAGVALALASLALAPGMPLGALPHGAGLGLATAIAFAALFAAIARIGSARSAVATMVEPVTTVLLAATILGEQISGRVGVGTVLIVAALPVLATTRRRRQIPSSPDAL